MQDARALLCRRTPDYHSYYSWIQLREAVGFGSCSSLSISCHKLLTDDCQTDHLLFFFILQVSQESKQVRNFNDFMHFNDSIHTHTQKHTRSKEGNEPRPGVLQHRSLQNLDQTYPTPHTLTRVHTHTHTQSD